MLRGICKRLFGRVAKPIKRFKLVQTAYKVVFLNEMLSPEDVNGDGRMRDGE